MVGRNLKLMPVISAMLICLASCGYHFSGEGAGPKPGLVRIAIPVFENKTSEPDLGAKIAEALRQEFIRKGNMKVVTVAEAEAVFKGTVTNIRVIPVGHHAVSAVSNQITVQNMILLSADIRCEDKQTHKIIWRSPNFTVHQFYQTNNNPLQPDPVTGFDNRQAALDFLAQDMSRRVHDNFLENF
jgi:hypothetical protein